MRERADTWRGEAYPFGSEMPWDSTGQEEVYDWTQYFGLQDKANVTLNAILGYTPVLPSWGYNGKLAALLGLSVRGQVSTHRAPASPLWFRPQCNSAAQRVSESPG